MRWFSRHSWKWWSQNHFFFFIIEAVMFQVALPVCLHVEGYCYKHLPDVDCSVCSPTLIHVVWEFNPCLLCWFTVNACPSLSVCLSLSACPHRSTLPKSGHRKYGPPSVQLAHDLTLWQLDSHSLYCVCLCVPLRKHCALDLSLMCFFFSSSLKSSLLKKKLEEHLWVLHCFSQIIHSRGSQTKVNSHTLDVWSLQGKAPWSSLWPPKEKRGHWWPRAQSGQQQ